ncbi:MAG: cellulase family glycosylhydrolase [Thermoguttaceae bacterium]
MRSRRCPITAILLLSLTASVPCGAAEPLGLYVRDGVVFRGGKPYRGIGANYFSLFSRRLKDPSDTSYRSQLKQLSEARIPFVRFMCGGFWPIDCELYLRDKRAYFALLDDVVEAAGENDIGLIPSLFWHMSTVPDIVGEPIDQLGNPDSKSIRFIRRYTEEVVTRYQDSPAIWGWEFGNEYNLHADLPNAATHRPPVWPQLKTARRRTERDELTSAHLLEALAAFAQSVRRHDKTRLLISGNSIPRPSAWHNTAQRSWQEDSVDQFGRILLRDNPDPIGTISVHLYPRENNEYSGRAKDVAQLIGIVQRYAHRAKKPLFIGEFGVPAQLDTEEERALFEELTTAIAAGGVPLAAFWVFDHPQQNKTWNVTFDNRRAYMLEIIGRANARIGRPSKSAKSTDGSL